MQEHLIERVPALMWPSSRASAKRLKAIQDDAGVELMVDHRSVVAISPQ
jgi:hypothetical protein